jgi:hypothetical protein
MMQESSGMKLRSVPATSQGVTFYIPQNQFSKLATATGTESRMMVHCFMSGDTFLIQIFSTEYQVTALSLSSIVTVQFAISFIILKVNFFFARDEPLQEIFWLEMSNCRRLSGWDVPVQDIFWLQVTHFRMTSGYG